jgi:hypothetical protein
MAGRNANPSGDGDLTLYNPDPEAYGGCIHPRVRQTSSRTSGNWRIIYVNGMATTARKHATTSRQLATIAGMNVTGIYNQCGTDGSEGVMSFLADLWECAQDQTLPVGRTMNPRVRRLLTMTEASRAEAIGNAVLRNNVAAQTLYTELLAAARANQWTIVVCHSQGNLITTNALWVLKHVRENAPTQMGKIRVFGLASPSASWPPNRQGGLRFNLYRHSGDPVTLLSFPWIGESAATVAPPTVTRERLDPRTGDTVEYQAPGSLSFSFHDVTTYYFMREDFQRDLHTTLRGS